MKIKTHKCFVLALFFTCLSAAAFAQDNTHNAISSSTLEPPEKTSNGTEYEAVMLRGLNKVTGKTSTLETPVGATVRFGTLDISIYRCWRSAPEDRPESAALLEVLELKPGVAPERVFLGWMFASSPGLSGLEHPVYDITVIKCETKEEDEGKPETPAKEKSAK